MSQLRRLPVRQLPPRLVQAPHATRPCGCRHLCHLPRLLCCCMQSSLWRELLAGVACRKPDGLCPVEAGSHPMPLRRQARPGRRPLSLGRFGAARQLSQPRHIMASARQRLIPCGSTTFITAAYPYPCQCRQLLLLSVHSIQLMQSSCSNTRSRVRPCSCRAAVVAAAKLMFVS